MKILALDPSINSVGWCSHGQHTLWGTIRTKGEGDGERLRSLREQVKELIQAQEPTVAVVEKAPGITYMRSQNKQSGRGMNAEAMQKLNMAYGVILGTLSEAGIPTDTWLPEEYKAKGNFGRVIICLRQDEVQRLVETYFPGQKFNVHEAHAILMCLRKADRMKMEAQRRSK